VEGRTRACGRRSGRKPFMDDGHVTNVRVKHTFNTWNIPKLTGSIERLLEFTAYIPKAVCVYVLIDPP
jgi:hypothetical protein